MRESVKLMRSRRAVSAVLAVMMMIVLVVAFAALTYSFTFSMIETKIGFASEQVIIENVNFAITYPDLTAFPSDTMFVDENNNGEYDDGEAIIEDGNGNGKYNRDQDVVVCGEEPQPGTVLTAFPSDTMFVDDDNDGVYNCGEAIVKDVNGDGKYDSGDIIISGEVTNGYISVVLRNTGAADVLIDRVYVDRSLKTAYLSAGEADADYTLLPEELPSNQIRYLKIEFSWAESTTYHVRVVTDKGVGIEGSFTSPPY